MDYKSAGVDIDAGNDTVRRIKALARATFTDRVLSDIGSFGGLFDLSANGCREPVLVSSADGVGTKLKVAYATGRHDIVGADLVNHCVNDILVQGARPLFFLDYLATGRLSPATAEQVIAGVARACRENGCALIGGETAEMPGFYADGEYDLAGFIVGLVEKSSIVDSRDVTPGDALVALPSTGLHTNGYSLARRVLFETAGFTPETVLPALAATVGDALLAPHRSYLRPIEPLLEAGVVKGMAHITGGGITENLPRALPARCGAEVRLETWTPPPIFGVMQQCARIPRDEMLRTFNMGVGLIVICGADAADRVLRLLGDGDRGAWVVGTVVAGDRAVRYV